MMCFLCGEKQYSLTSYIASQGKITLFFLFLYSLARKCAYKCVKWETCIQRKDAFENVYNAKMCAT